MGRAEGIETPRLFLRPPKRSDFKVWRRLREANHEHLQPWEPLWGQTANSRAEWRVRMRAWRKGRRQGRIYAYFLLEKESRNMLGGLAFSHVRWGASQTATLGYWLDQQVTGHGYMTEAVSYACNWAGDRLGLARIEASTMPENKNSRKVLERCGFCEEGLAQSYLQIAGERRDHILYGLTIAP